MPAIAGISGGRTSAFMAFHLAADIVLSFQNTAREHSKTYDFIARLEDDLQRPIVRLEYRAPPRGDAPKFSTFEVVEHRHLKRRGEPFRDLLECMAAFRRKHKGLGPVAPWARSRVCTAYLKIRTQRKYCASLGWGHQRDYTEYVGLRADEPDRVKRMHDRNRDLDTDEVAPLDTMGITKSDVLRFWASKSYDLDLDEHDGNCTGCFLKDEADLARALVGPEGDPAWWIGIERDFAPMRRGRPSYAQVYAEAQARLEIATALSEGRAYTVDLPARRVKLIVAQEIDRAKHGPSKVSCECDAAKADDFDDDDSEAA